jgi:hypothetical protein
MIITQDIDSLIREMLAIERGNYDDGTPTPTVVIPPKTSGGLPTTVHYKTVVGIVYYSMPAMLTEDGKWRQDEIYISMLVQKIYGILSRYNEHLSGYRATAASTATIMRHKNRVRPETILCGPKSSFKLTTDSFILPARIIFWSFDEEIPSHISKIAAFTWYFLPIESAIELPANSSANVNALVASIYYDEYQFMIPRQITSLKYSDFKPNTAFDVLNEFSDSAFLAGYGSKLIFVGNKNHLYPPKDTDMFVGDPPANFAMRQCSICLAPFCNTAILINNARKIFTRTVFDEQIALCEFCWAAVTAADIKVTKINIPQSQAELARTFPEYEKIACYLENDVTILGEGIFMVDIADGRRVVLTSQKWGLNPSINLCRIVDKYKVDEFITNVNLATFSCDAISG